MGARANDSMETLPSPRAVACRTRLATAKVSSKTLASCGPTVPSPLSAAQGIFDLAQNLGVARMQRVERRGDHKKTLGRPLAGVGMQVFGGVWAAYIAVVLPPKFPHAPPRLGAVDMGLGDKNYLNTVAGGDAYTLLKRTRRMQAQEQPVASRAGGQTEAGNQRLSAPPTGGAHHPQKLHTQ